MRQSYNLGTIKAIRTGWCPLCHNVQGWDMFHALEGFGYLLVLFNFGVWKLIFFPINLVSVRRQVHGEIDG